MPNKQLYGFADFRGGVNVDASLDHLADNELQVAANIDLSERGGLRKRDGVTTVVSGSPFGASDKVTQLFEWSQSNGTSLIMAVANKGLYKIAGTTATYIRSVQSDKIGYYVFQNKLYFVDGNSYYQYDGTTCTGVAFSSFTMSGTGSGTDVQAGTYYCFCRFFTGAGEYQNFQDTPVVSVTVTVGQTFVWTGVVPPHENVSRIHLYRTDVGYENDDAFFLAMDIPANNFAPAGVYTESKVWEVMVMPETAQSTWDGESLTPIKRCKFAVRHIKSNRFFFAGDSSNQSALYYSEPNQPSIVKPYAVLYPTTGDGPVTGLVVFVDAVLVFFKNSIWAWRGMDPEFDAVWQKLPTAEGTEAPDTIELTTNSLTYMGSGGIYSLSPGILGYNIEVNVDKSLVANIAENKVSKLIKSSSHQAAATATFDAKNGRYILGYSPSGAAQNSGVLVYDEELKAFTTWTGFNVYSLLYTRDGLYIGSDKGVLKQGTGANDVLPAGATNIACKVVTKNYQLDSVLGNFLLHRFMLTVEGVETANPVDIAITIDGKEEYTEQIDGITVDDPLYVARRHLRKRGKRIEMELQHTANKQFRLYSIGFVANPIRVYGERL